MIGLTNNEQAIIDLFIKKSNEPMNTIQVCEQLGTRYTYTNQLLWQLGMRGLLQKTRRIKSRSGYVYYHLNEAHQQIQEINKM